MRNNHFSESKLVAKEQGYQPYMASLPLITRINWTISDTRASIFLGLGFIYLAFKEPLLVVVILSLALFFYCLNRVISFIPYLNNFIQRQIHFWHIAGLIMALTMTLTIFEMPAQAIFLSGLEKFLTNIAQQSSSGGTSSIDPQAITLVFNAIRGVFLLVVGVRYLPITKHNKEMTGDQSPPKRV